MEKNQGGVEGAESIARLIYLLWTVEKQLKNHQDPEQSMAVAGKVELLTLTAREGVRRDASSLTFWSATTSFQAIRYTECPARQSTWRGGRTQSKCPVLPGPAAGKTQLCKEVSRANAKLILYINTQQFAGNLGLGELLQQLTSCAWRASGSYHSVKSTDSYSLKHLPEMCLPLRDEEFPGLLLGHFANG